MEDMKYITQIDVSPADISECLVQGGYKAHQHNHDIFGDVVVVYYEFEYKGKMFGEYCRWVTDDIAAQETKQIRKYERIDPNLRCLFNIMYYSGGLSSLSKIFKQIMTCYGGYIYCEHRFFDKNSISRLQNVKLGQKNQTAKRYSLSLYLLLCRRRPA